MIDLIPACQRTAAALAHVTDDRLDGPTPCEKLRPRDLVAHVGGLAVPIASDAPRADRVIAMTGRDPAWRSG
jgi:hypothetical protein